MKPLHIDFETRSTVDIKKTGAYVYAQHPSTEPHCMMYAFGDEPVQSWKRGEPIPPEVENHIVFGGLVVGHNSAFERQIFNFIMGPRYGWPVPAVEQWRCTMVMGYAMALPGALEHIGPALGTGFEKDMQGNRLMLAMAKPKKLSESKYAKELKVYEGLAAEARRLGDEDTANEWAERSGELRAQWAAGGPFWREAPEDLERLYAYCVQDVESERAADKRLVRLRPFEQDLWHLDQKINDRGCYVDVDLAKRNLAIVDAHTAALDRQMAMATDYEVTACSNVNQLKVYLKRWNVFEDLDSDSLSKDVIAELLARQDLDPKARRAIEIRAEGGKASVSKIDALLNGLGSDGRANGLTQFHAASTGRWGGRRFQPQNLVRPDEEFDIDGAIDVILSNPTHKAMDILDAMYGPPITCVSYTLRGMIKAAPGHKIVAADFNNIEGVVLACLAGEQPRIDAFKKYFAGKGPDLYLVAAAGIYGLDVTKISKKTHPQERQIGKVAELACGYGGGVGAFQTMAATYGLHVPDSQADEIKTAWREANPSIKQFWSDCEDAALRAIASPGRAFTAGPLTYKVAGSFLWCRLPSGRALCYPYPKIMPVKTPWGAMKDAVTFKTVPNVSNRKKIVWDDTSNTARWARISTYGGDLAQGPTQAVARDILAEAMVRLERENYPVILTVHDESVSEVPEGYGSAREYEQIMCELPTWAARWPIAASGFEAERYRK